MLTSEPDRSPAGRTDRSLFRFCTRCETDLSELRGGSLCESCEGDLLVEHARRTFATGPEIPPGP